MLLCKMQWNLLIFLRVTNETPVFLQIYEMKWNQSLRLFYCILKLDGYQKTKLQKR